MRVGVVNYVGFLVVFEINGVVIDILLLFVSFFLVNYDQKIYFNINFFVLDMKVLIIFNYIYIRYLLINVLV